MAFSFLEHWSPEVTLNNCFDDMKKSGVDGLKKHLTSNALSTVESFESVSGRPEIKLITNAFMGGNAVNFLLEKLSECDWTIKDVMKGSESSRAIVGFNYQDKMTGTIELTMIKEHKKWKIDSISNPSFEKFPMPHVSADQSSES